MNLFTLLFLFIFNNYAIANDYSGSGDSENLNTTEYT